MVGDDGMRVSVGDASVRIVTTPGHKPGTLSYLFEVRDNGKPLRVAYLLSNHSDFNDAFFKAHTAAGRKPAERNPFEVSTDGVARYFAVVQARTTG